MSSSLSSLCITLTIAVSTAAWGAPAVAAPYLSGRDYCQLHADLFSTESGAWVQVPVDYAKPDGAKTEVYYHFVGVYDPKKPTAALFTGGPGQASHLPVERIPLFADAGFNLLTFDQRGNACPRPASESIYLSPEFYSSEFNARDFEAVRKQVGIDKVAVWGGSYGSVPATIYASIFPEHSETIILEGVTYDVMAGLFSERHLAYSIIQKLVDGLDPAVLTTVQFGAVDWKVREHPDAVVIAEFEAYPEPKALSSVELSALTERYGGYTGAARAIGGVSEGFIRQNARRAVRVRTQTARRPLRLS